MNAPLATLASAASTMRIGPARRLKADWRGGDATGAGAAGSAMGCGGSQFGEVISPIQCRTRTSSSVEDPQPLRPLDGLGAVADLELAIQRARVFLDGVRRQEQLPRDFGVRRPLGDDVEPLLPARRQQRG